MKRERARIGRIWTGSKIVPREAASSKGQVARKRSKVSERTNSGSCSKGLAALRLPALGPALRLERSPRFGPLITSPCSGSTDTRVAPRGGYNTDLATHLLGQATDRQRQHWASEGWEVIDVEAQNFATAYGPH